MQRGTWECEECGATALHTPRKNATEAACGNDCKWIFTPQNETDQKSPENDN